jgi:hypothetical protein
MEAKDHLSGVGAIVTNLQALESTLRGFLVERFGQCAGFPKMGDKVACRNYLTEFVSLAAEPPSTNTDADHGRRVIAGDMPKRWSRKSFTLFKVSSPVCSGRHDVD